MSEYKIEATTSSGGAHVIITAKRETAIRFSAAMLHNPEYCRVSVTTGGKVFEGEEIRRIP